MAKFAKAAWAAAVGAVGVATVAAADGKFSLVEILTCVGTALVAAGGVYNLKYVGAYSNERTDGEGL